MNNYTVHLHIPEQDIEADVIALSMSEAIRLALEEFEGLNISLVSTAVWAR